MSLYMIHFTRDGEYVDGVALTENQSADTEIRRKLANTYESCQAWTYTGPKGSTAGLWYSIPAAGLPWARWEPETISTVPECVRVAEMLRGE
jgi:hypothetical protein